MKMYMQSILRGFLFVAILGLAPAFAGTPLEDRGNTTYDPNTGLEWLDLWLTAGQSYQSIQNGWNGYTTSEGFRLATRDEILQLFTHAGATGINSGWNPTDAAAASHLLSLVGTTLSLTDLDRSWMFYDASTEPSLPTPSHVPSAVFGIWRAPGGDQGAFLTPGIFPSQDYGSGEMASALVRVVPEPSTGMLCISALSVSIFAAQRRRWFAAKTDETQPPDHALEPGARAPVAIHASRGPGR
jgi:hypothetical protein